LFFTLLTAFETAYMSRLPAVGGAMSPRSRSTWLRGSSHSAQWSGAIAIGMRSWIRPMLSVAVVVMIVYVGTTRAGWSSGRDLSYQTS
jgi:hypothetical protein